METRKSGDGCRFGMDGAPELTAAAPAAGDFFPASGKIRLFFFRPKKFVWLGDFFSFPVDYFPNLYYTGYQMERMASQPEYEEEYSNELQPHV